VHGDAAVRLVLTTNRDSQIPADGGAGGTRTAPIAELFSSFNSKTLAVASSLESRYLCQINTIPLALLFVIPTAIATATAAAAQRSSLTPQPDE
jgi:hypothetical protein